MEKPETSSTLVSMLRDGSLCHRAPAHLRERVLADIPRGVPRRAVFVWGGAAAGGVRAWIQGGLAGLAVCAVALGTAVLIQRPAATGTIAQEVVSSHVRAQLSQHPIDIISTDQHTVKPWFNGKIDYAPPVVDFAEKGFPLVGGRIDYLDHRAVAVLIYHYQQHPIDVYVYPDRRNSAAPVALSSDGYSIAHWQRDGMTYWAITDASPEFLKAFEQAAK
ncbi:transmembrane transcriptional regulator (anti-sigma factor) [Pandoraea terrae]|uniref:Transmembrane transcriptional regulator (Anti-sigma factor) n=1 Tax=Pandoraea terrae TaxID=1537710 RepID=A0A5E4S040_9BURK|nr:anti-sigma factor [Pandoraea terrae]VVD68483.1 transmembrane transcriptional regulator (anti-sigma factor) [Pandoraea terrae]